MQSFTNWYSLCDNFPTYCRINPLAEDLEEANSRDHVKCMRDAYKILDKILQHHPDEQRTSPVCTESEMNEDNTTTTA